VLPPWLAVVSSRVHALVRRRQLDDEFDREVAAHLDLAVDELVRRGWSPEAARRAAILRLGGPMQLKEDHREQRGLAFVDTTLQDLRYALRALGKHPAFSTIAVATLAIGIGAGTAMFTVVNAVLLRPLPYAAPDRLVEISEVNPLKGWTHTVVAPANLADWRARNRVFSDIAGYVGADDRGASQYQVFLSGSGEAQPLNGLAVMGNLFDVLGVSPQLGRTFSFDETFDGRDRSVVLAYGTWQTVFGADPAIIGRTLVLSGRSITVIGVMPRAFFFPSRRVQFWMPMGLQPDVFATMRRPHWMNTVARLQPGVSLAQARDQMTAIAAELEHAYPDTNTKMSVRIEPLRAIMASDARPSVLMLFGAVGVLFLIVCANIASLQLGRGIGRSRELAIRRAIGAGRGRLIRQLLTESLVLSAIGGALGTAMAAATPAAISRFAPSTLPAFATPQLDRTVLLFAVALATLAPVLFGIVPAIAASRSQRLTERRESPTRLTASARDLVVACEVGLSVVLVVGAVLLVRSLIRLERVDPGFNPDHVVTFKITLPAARYPQGADRVRAFGEIERRLSTAPGVDVVGATSTLALHGYTWTGDATVEGRAAEDYERELRHESVTPGYFPAMGIRLLAGRMLDERDGKDANVTLVNASLARTYFRDADPIGKRIKFGRPQDDDPWTTVVGVVADEKQDAMDTDAKPEVYVPLAENPQNRLTFVLRSRASVDSTLTAARQRVLAVDKDLALTDVAPLADVVEDSMAHERFRTVLLTAFAGVALMLAALGIYGVLAYFVSQRSRELGIRVALGARSSELFGLVIGQGMRPVAAGAAAGLAGSLALTSLVRSLLFAVDALDLPAFVAALALLVLVALTACTPPAWKATRVDPLIALRDE
jgi:putative ABC transport system permease protein